MSTKTLRKRIALVAVSSMGLGLLTVVPANAAVIAGTSTITPVRVSFTGAVQDSVPAADVTLATTDAAWADADVAGGEGTITVTLTSAPSAAAQITIDSVLYEANTDTSVTLADDGVLTDTNADVDTAAESLANGLTFAANTVGSYTGTIVIDDAATADSVSIPFSFTTSGAVSTITVTPAATTILVGGRTDVTVAVKDAAGNATTVSTVDSLALSDSTGTFEQVAGGADQSLTAADLISGSVTAVFTGAGAAGSATLTVTPQGTLPALGFAAVTATVTESGTIDATEVTSLGVSTPASAVAAGTIDGGDRTATIPELTSSLVVSFTGVASAQHRFKVSGSSGTINGAAATTAQYINATTSAAGAGTISLTLGGSILIAGQTVTVEQVTVLNASIDPDAGGAATTTDIVITQTSRAAAAGTITLNPTGEVLASIGTTTSVVVNVADQFDGVYAGATVRAYRTAVANGNLLSTATSDASGNATVTVTNVSGITSGTAETYRFTATNAANTYTATATLVITYTTTGAGTSLSVNIDDTGSNLDGALGAADEDVTDTEAVSDALKIPAILVPTDGTADDAAGAAVYTKADGTVAGATLEIFKVVTNSTPNNVTVFSTTGGAYVSADASAAWNEGLQTLSVAEGASAYIYATTTGLHTVTATSGGKTVTFQFYAYNLATDYYTLSAVADSTTIAPGATGVVTITVKDVFGNTVDTAADLLLNTASGKVLLGGNVFTADMGTGAAGTGQFSVIANNATGTGSVVIAPKTTGANAWATGYTAPTGASSPVSSVTVDFTVQGSTTKSAAELAADAATAAATAAGTKADAATAQSTANAAAIAALTALVEKLIADKATSDAATATAIQDVLDVAADANDNAQAATEAALLAAEAADAATAAAMDAVDAVTAATEQVVIAQDFATEATDAANAATDAANAAAEAADNATGVAEEALASVTALASQLAAFTASMRAQFTTLTNLVVKIQKKVKA